MTNQQIFSIVLYLAAGIILGWVIKLIVIPLLRRIAVKTKWKSDDLIIDTISSWIIFWFFLFSCLLALSQLDFDANTKIIIQKSISSLYIFSFTWIISRILSGMLDIRSAKDDSVIPSTSIIGNIVKVIVFCVGVMVILQVFNVSVTPILTALGVGGIAVALALQPTLSNLFSGLQIIASGKLNVGDTIQLESGQRGIITDITWRNTTIRTAQNNIIIVPNSKMADSVIENYNLSDEQVTFNVTVGVSYGSDLRKVERISAEVAKEVLQRMNEGIKDFDPVVRFFSFGESGIQLRVFLSARDFESQFAIASEFIKALHERYQKEGIEIPFPTRTVLMQNVQ